MITVHHLNNSRSQRILWLLEELELPYDIKHYQRHAQTNLAPPELMAVHPLGKSPVITDAGLTMIESGAIVDYILRTYGKGRLQPAADKPSDFEVHQQWLHYAEGSGMLPFLLKLYVSRLGEAGAPLSPRIESEIANHIGYVNESLTGKDWLVGNTLTGADIMMSFVGEVAGARTNRTAYPNVDAWVKRFQARPAYLRGLAKGGIYNFGPQVGKSAIKI